MAAMLGGCGGGGGGTTPSPLSTPTPPSEPTSSSATTPISPGGGSESTTLGAQTLTVAAPSGAFASTTNLTITLEAPTSITATFARARAASRVTQSVPSGAVPLAAFIIDAGAAALNVPLTVMLSGIAGPATGQSVLISGYANSAFGDVANTTYASKTYSETTDPHYPGITLAAKTLYVLYAVPTANVATPTAMITVSGPATVSLGQQATYTATEATANGFPFFGHSFTYALSSATLGTINPSTGVLSAATTGGAGDVNATDSAVATFSGTEAVADSTARPGTTGLTEQYAGTLTEVDANNAIAGGPGATPAPTQTPVSTTTTSVATVAVSAAADAADTSGSTTGVTFTANETDAANLTTLTSTTTSTVLYQQQTNGTINVLLKQLLTAESTGVSYEHVYGAATATPKLTTILPETNGTFSNDASETYYETDPGIGVTGTGQQVTTTSVIAGTGTYTSTFLDPNAVTGTPVADTATENGNFSGVLDYNSIDDTFQIRYGAPTNGLITLALVDPSSALDNVFTFPSYIPAGMTTPSTETDTIVTSVPLGTSCTDALKYPTATGVTQTKTVVDAIFGTVETRTTTSYDVLGVGTVCTVLSDTVNSYYDYGNQEGGALIAYDTSATPILTTTVSETLSLESTNATQLQSSLRSTQSVGTSTMPIVALAAHVQHVAHQRAIARLRAFTQRASVKLRGGLVK